MELVNLLPDEIKRIVYEYDTTYKDIFDSIIKTIPDAVMMYSLTKTKKDKYGWSKMKSIFKLRNMSMPNKHFQREDICIYDCSHSIIGLLQKKLNDFYGYNFKCNLQSDWNYFCYNGRSLYSKHYWYSDIAIHVNIFLRFAFQKYAAKSYISDKQLKKQMKRGRYMDMGHYQRCEV